MFASVHRTFLLIYGIIVINNMNGKVLEKTYESLKCCRFLTDLGNIAISIVFSQAQDERNYHVFYEMLSAMSEDEKSHYGLQTASKYFYLNQVWCGLMFISIKLILDI